MRGRRDRGRWERGGEGRREREEGEGRRERGGGKYSMARHEGSLEYRVKVYLGWEKREFPWCHQCESL